MPVDVHIAHVPTASQLVPWVYGAFQLAVLYVLLWLLLGDAFLPRGAGFSLLVLYLASTACGLLVKRLSRRMPPLLGMLLAGLVLRNLPGEPLRSDHAFLGHAFGWWSNKLRACALATIMLRAGLGLDLVKLRKIGLAMARLAFCPCIAEALTVALPTLSLSLSLTMTLTLTPTPTLILTLTLTLTLTPTLTRRSPSRCSPPRCSRCRRRGAARSASSSRRSRPLS